MSDKNYDRCLEAGANERAMSQIGGYRSHTGSVALSHIDDQGRARMVDVGGKDETDRRARAEALVRMARETLKAIDLPRWPRATS